MAGYSQAELDDIQARWDLRFPPDLVELMLRRRPLLSVLQGRPLQSFSAPSQDSEDQPVLLGRGWDFDWITTPADTISEILRWPYEGFLFDVEQNGVWWSSWGPRPATEAERASRLAEVMAAAPKLIPLAGHRYLPETPFERGNPVFSVYQTDVIHYGVDLADWVVCEEQGWSAGRMSGPQSSPKPIPFWSLAVEGVENLQAGRSFFNRPGGLPDA